MDALEPAGRPRSDATVALGVNVDDLGDHRPGPARRPVARGARFPLVEAGLTQGRRPRGWPGTWACGRGTSPPPPAWPPACPTAPRSRWPSSARSSGPRPACAASGLGDLRVRHYDDLARLEVPVAALDVVLARRPEVVAAVRAAGYRYVTLDLEGLRSGNLNAALDLGGEALA